MNTRLDGKKNYESGEAIIYIQKNLFQYGQRAQEKLNLQTKKNYQ